MNAGQILRALWLLCAVLSLNKSLVSAAFEGCDGIKVLYPNYTETLRSDNYPGFYKPGSSCRYRYTTLENHYIVIDCTINFDRGANDCTSEAFYVAADGDLNLKGSEKLCGADTFSRHSQYNRLVLAYTSQGSFGEFECTLRVKEKQCECGVGITRNIAHGQEAFINEYPSMVALKTKGPYSTVFCSASIISSRYLLTAAHCTLHTYFSNLSELEAWVGSHDLGSTRDTIYAKPYTISDYMAHKHYNYKNNLHDIALLQTSTTIEFSRGVGPICLPPYSVIGNDFAWEEVDVIGWGSTNFKHGPSPTLQKITVTTTDHKTCKHIYKDIAEIFPSLICTRDYLSTKRDSCLYDSGGPVIFRKNGRQYLLGIISFGIECDVDGDSTGVNTRVTSYLPWIYKNTGGSSCTIQF